MTLNQAQFSKVVEEAKARTNDRRWLSAIDKALAGVVSGWWVITELFDSVAITTESGRTYFANGSCQCKAYELGQPCKHRALARLLDLYHEAENVTRAVSREELMADIETTWARKFPGESLADNLMARFKVNKLSFLNVDFLRRVLAAIA